MGDAVAADQTHVIDAVSVAFHSAFLVCCLVLLVLRRATSSPALVRPAVLCLACHAAAGTISAALAVAVAGSTSLPRVAAASVAVRNIGVGFLVVAHAVCCLLWLRRALVARGSTASVCFVGLPCLCVSLLCFAMAIVAAVVLSKDQQQWSLSALRFLDWGGLVSGCWMALAAGTAFVALLCNARVRGRSASALGTVLLSCSSICYSVWMVLVIADAASLPASPWVRLVLSAVPRTWLPCVLVFALLVPFGAQKQFRGSSINDEGTVREPILPK
jgi:hypothetical protein